MDAPDNNLTPPVVQPGLMQQTPTLMQLGLLMIGGMLGTAIVTGLVVAWVVGGRNQVEPVPPVPVERTAAEEAAEVLPAIAAGYGEAFNNASHKVESGEISSDRELVDFLQPATIEVRDAAKAAFDAAMEREMPDGEITEDDRQRVAEILRDVGEAFQKN